MVRRVYASIVHANRTDICVHSTQEVNEEKILSCSNNTVKCKCGFWRSFVPTCREEYHLLDMPVGEEAPATITLLNNESIGSRPVPVATVRSSKLAAMAATMKKSQQDTDQEIDTETSVDDDISDNDTASLVKLEDILTVPNVPNNNNTRNNIEYRINTGFTPKKVNKGFNHVYGGKSILKSNSNRNWHEENAAVKSSREDKANCIAAGTSSSKDLSLSCVNPTATPEANYRLNSM